MMVKEGDIGCGAGKSAIGELIVDEFAKSVAISSVKDELVGLEDFVGFWINHPGEFNLAVA